MARWKTYSKLSLISILIAFIVPTLRDFGGYAINIYSLLGAEFFLFVVLAWAMSFIALWNSGNDRQTLISSLLLIFSNIPLIFAPYLLGFYTFGREDVITHIGNIIEIFSSSHIPADNIYPGGHIVAGYFASHVNVDFHQVVMIVPGFFLILYFIGMLLLMRRRSKVGGLLIVAAPILSLPIYGHEMTMFLTSILGFSFIPLFMFTMWREYITSRWVVMSLILMSAITLIHPVAALFCVSFAFLLNIQIVVRSSFNRIVSSFSQTFALAAIFYMWHFNVYSSVSSISRAFVILISPFGESKFQSYTSVISRANVELVDLIEVAFFKYGRHAYAFGLAGLTLAYYLYSNTENLDRYWPMLVAYPLLVLLSVFSFFNSSLIGFSRTSRYAILISIPLSGVFLHDISMSARRGEYHHIIRYGLVIVIMTGLVLSLSTVYFSPLTKDVSSQVTKSEVYGSSWFIERANHEESVSNLGITIRRFGSLGGVRISEANKPPDHFEYGNHDAGPPTGYLIIAPIAELSNPVLYPDYREYWRYAPADFDQLDKSSEFNQIYSSGGFNIYYA